MTMPKGACRSFNCLNLLTRASVDRRQCSSYFFHTDVKFGYLGMLLERGLDLTTLPKLEQTMGVDVSLIQTQQPDGNLVYTILIRSYDFYSYQKGI